MHGGIVSALSGDINRSFVGVAPTDSSRRYAVRGARGTWASSSAQSHVVKTLCLGGSDNGGNGGAGRHIRGGGSGDGSCGNNNNNNNNGSGNFGGGGDCDGFGDHLRRCSGPALLGALALVTASTAFPAASRATPVSLSSLLHGTAGSGSSGKAILSSSAPQGGGFGGSLSDSLAPSLQRSSVGATYGPSASFAGSPGPSPGPSPGSPGSGSGRPRSKVMHVACKGSTLVVPLTGHDPKGVDIPLPQPRFLPWQRRKIVDAPVELSEREARMLAARQNRVRDSLLVQ